MIVEPIPSENEDDVPLARSIGEIFEQHLEEIIGPEMAARYRRQP